MLIKGLSMYITNNNKIWYNSMYRKTDNPTKPIVIGIGIAVRKEGKGGGLDFTPTIQKNLMVAYVHIEYFSYQFSEESKGGGIHPPPVLTVPKNAWSWEG